MKNLTAKSLLRNYSDGMLTYQQLVCSLSELPEKEINALKPSLKAQVYKVKRILALEAGIKSAQERPLVYLGSFAKYADDDQ